MGFSGKTAGVSLLASACLFSATARASFSGRYTVTNLGDGFNSWLINDRGDLVGDQVQSDGTSQAVYESNGKTTVLGTAESIYISDLNNQGVVVGGLNNVFGVSKYWLNGVVQNIVPPPDSGEYAQINDRGDYVYTTKGHFSLHRANGDVDLAALGPLGEANLKMNNDDTIVATDYSNLENIKAVIWKNGVVTTIQPFGGNFTTVRGGIADTGEVAGTSSTSNDTSRGFTWLNGKMTDVGTLPGDNWSGLDDVNDLGAAVGSSDRLRSPGHQRAVIWNGDQLRDLNSMIPRSSGWQLEVATAINDKGQILGVGNRGEFLLTPVAGNAIPLPSPALIGLVTFPLAIFASRRCRANRAVSQ